MNQEQRQAYEWAKNQDYQSVAARYAKILAGLVDEITPQNEPLTLEQLREMDGEPVYCINIDDYSTKEWMIVGKDDCEGRRYIFDFSTYSRNWLAYRRPPEGET